MKVLLSSHGASPYGAERVLLVLAEGLAQRGHDVTLEIPHAGPALDAAAKLPGVVVWHSARARLPRNAAELAKYVIDALPATLRLWRRIRRERYDVAWVNSIYNPFPALAARFAGVPVVWHLHERNLPRPLGFAMGLTLRIATVRVSVSRFIAGTFERAFSGSSLLLHEPQTRPLSPLPLRERADELVVGYMGQLEPRKRVTDLLAALARIRHVRAVVVGDGKQRPQIEAALRRLGLQARVQMVGVQRDVVHWYGEMDCVVLPARDEPCPLVAIEAMALGRPVIASDHGGHPEVLRDAALYFPMGDAAALAEQIQRLEREPAVASELRERGIRRARDFGIGAWLDGAERIALQAAEPASHPAPAGSHR